MGSSDQPEIVTDPGRPKRVIGKCPNNIGQVERVTLLQTAIAAPRGDRRTSYDKRLYLVRRGVIYECQTSDAGRTFHAYPYHGTLPRKMIEELGKLPEAQSHPEEFQDWLANHIESR